MTTISVTVKCSTGDKFTIEVDTNLLVSEFKALLADKAKIPAAQQRLIFSGHVLKDPHTLESYSLKEGSVIHLVRGAAPPDTTPASPAPAPSSVHAPSSPGDMFGDIGGLGGFGGLGGMGSLEQMMQNPSVVREMMNSPMMQSIMQNPEIIRSLLANNPQIREVIERNPEVGHLLNDPQILRQTMEMARNPELMREMMRNTDRAMSNIESHPEGFNLLRQMYTNVQEPMMNAATQQAQATGSLFPQPTQNTPTPTATPSPNPNTAPLPNPWAPPPPASHTPPQNPAGGASGGGAGGGLPEFSDFGMGLPGGDVASLLQNPAIQGMVQQMLSNPELMQQMFDANPMARQMMEANPQLRQMMQNPQFIRQLTDPQNIQAMMQMQQALQQLQRGTGGGLFNFLGGGAGGAGAMGMDWGPNMFGSFGAPAGLAGMGGQPVGGVQQPQAPPEERFREQLQQLQEMGFTDQQANIAALLATNGFVQGAIERLLNS